jgi:hypothetical protein
MALFDTAAAAKRVSIASGLDFGVGLELGLISGMEVDGLKLKPDLGIIGVDGRAGTAISAPAWANIEVDFDFLPVTENSVTPSAIVKGKKKG